MAEPDVALIAFLRDVNDRKVLTNEHDFQVYLELPGEPPANVTTMAVAAEAAGWVREPADSVLWLLTTRGREALERGAA